MQKGLVSVFRFPVCLVMSQPPPYVVKLTPSMCPGILNMVFSCPILCPPALHNYPHRCPPALTKCPNSAKVVFKLLAPRAFLSSWMRCKNPLQVPVPLGQCCQNYTRVRKQPRSSFAMLPCRSIALGENGLEACPQGPKTKVSQRVSA
jgi:hypothetical protein